MHSNALYATCGYQQTVGHRWYNGKYAAINRGGAGCILLWAFILGAKAKQAKQSTAGIHVASLGGGAEVHAHVAHQLRQLGILEGQA
jgi:hypothetical protein